MFVLIFIALLALAESAYNTSEGAILPVCAILTGDLGRSVVANISTVEGTAQGEGDIECRHSSLHSY